MGLRVASITSYKVTSQFILGTNPLFKRRREMGTKGCMPAKAADIPLSMKDDSDPLELYSTNVH
jgi:hypothetical protein